ncbi:hypothetical protein FACS1894176_04300 [Bacteroidia bacterium]|nr:hypothetical protein FACS1894176_04300 [Bacteroidia bacterium]
MTYTTQQATFTDNIEKIRAEFYDYLDNFKVELGSFVKGEGREIDGVYNLFKEVMMKQEQLITNAGRMTINTEKDRAKEENTVEMDALKNLL